MTTKPAVQGTSANRGRAWLIALGIVAGSGVLTLALLVPAPRAQTVDSGTNAGNLPAPNESVLEPRVADAVRTARAAVVANPGNLDAWTRYANVLDVHNLYVEAAAAYREAVKLNPDDPQLNYFLAVMLWHTPGGAEEAETLLQRVAAMQPKYPPPLVRLGTWLAASGRYQEARKAFELALETDSTFMFAHRELGRTLVKLESFEQAVVHLELVEQAVPNDRETLVVLAGAYREIGQGEKAQRVEERARRADELIRLNDPVRDALEPMGVSGWHCFRRALDLIREGKFARADEQLVTVRQTLWSNPEVRVRLAEAYLFRNQNDVALREFQEVLAMRPGDPRAHLGLATLLTERGRFKQALEHWKPAIAAFPGDAAVHVGYANSLAASGDVTQAIVHYEIASKLEAPTAERLTNWGTALMRSGAIDDAMVRFHQAIELDANFADAHFNLGYLYEQQGRISDAIAHYKLGAANKPRHPAVKRLAELEKNAEVGDR